MAIVSSQTTKNHFSRNCKYGVRAWCFRLCSGFKVCWVWARHEVFSPEPEPLPTARQTPIRFRDRWHLNPTPSIRTIRNRHVAWTERWALTFELWYMCWFVVPTLNVWGSGVAGSQKTEDLQNGWLVLGFPQTCLL